MPRKSQLAAEATTKLPPIPEELIDLSDDPQKITHGIADEHRLPIEMRTGWFGVQ